MSDYQKVIIMGHLGRDPDTRTFNDGTQVSNFSVAVGERWRDKQGVKQERTTWFNCKAFGRTAEIAGQYLRKGSQVHVDGKLQTETWTDKNTGQERTGMSLRVDNLTLMGGPDGNADRPSPDPRAMAEQPSLGGGMEFDDDIPF